MKPEQNIDDLQYRSNEKGYIDSEYILQTMPVAQAIVICKQLKIWLFL